MEASKFDPHVNWLPPAYCLNTEFHALNPAADQLELERRILDDGDEDHEQLDNLSYADECYDQDASSISKVTTVESENTKVIK